LLARGFFGARVLADLASFFFADFAAVIRSSQYPQLKQYRSVRHNSLTIRKLRIIHAA
jgi:hypothetical protein